MRKIQITDAEFRAAETFSIFKAKGPTNHRVRVIFQEDLINKEKSK